MKEQYVCERGPKEEFAEATSQSSHLVGKRGEEQEDSDPSLQP